jgi:type I restriction enzyme, S subunit
MTSTRLGDVVAVKSGFAFKSADWLDVGVPVIKIANVKDGWVTLDGCSFVSEEVAQSARAFELTRGDVLISMTGHIGQVAKVRDEGRMLLNQRVGRFSIKKRDRINAEYLFQWLRLPEVRAVFAAHAYGAAQPNISPSLIEQQSIPLPPLPVQRRIASILSAYDDLIENNTRRIAILEEMARRIYEEWFVRFRFPGHEGVRMVESQLELVPEGWLVQAASTAMDINPSTKVPKEGLKPFLAMNCLSDGSMLIDTPGERDGNSGSKFRNGDTLFARITPCLENGKTGFVQFLPSDDAVAFGSTEFIVLRSRTLTPEFVYLLARSDAFRENAIKSMSGASGRQRVREACFGTFLLANPDQETLAKFAAVTRPMFQLIQSLAHKNSNLRTTRDLLLPKLISGELDVSAVPELEALAA